MAHKSRRIPAYVHHKPTGQARVRIDGKDHYLGKYGSPESHDRYDELVAEWMGAEPGTATSLTALLAAWWAECKRRYRKGKGQLGGAQNWRGLIRLLRTHHGDERADDLGPVKLRRLLEAEAEQQGWSLSYTKMQLAKVKRIYKWAVAEELASPGTYQKLAALEIRDGRETEPIPPVDDDLMNQTLPHLSPKIRDMVTLQRLSGMRPGELVVMRPEQVDRTGEIWAYTPMSHKTKHKGKHRVIYIGPKAQAILAPWLMKAEDFVFATRRAAHYTSDSYRRAITRACQRAGLPEWSPNQLRKRCATDVRAAIDVEASAALLGHASSVVTADHYAAVTRERALAAAKLLG